VSVRSLLDRRFPEEVENLLAHHGVDGRALTLELTESSLMVDPEVAKRTMHDLAELGVSVAIDDFGTGYSSDSRNAIVVRSTIELAHNLGLRTVAEGIEDAFTFERLRALGCELAQGFHMSKPLPAARLLQWWDNHSTAAPDAAVTEHQTQSGIIVPHLSVA
jgi:EAL domain-containing protein (putative c-di-GMP-specific phosphodiesterase class I)